MSATVKLPGSSSEFSLELDLAHPIIPDKCITKVLGSKVREPLLQGLNYYFILFYFMVFFFNFILYFILFYFILFCFILFYFIKCYFILFYFILLNVILFYFISFHFILLYRDVYTCRFATLWVWKKNEHF